MELSSIDSMKRTSLMPFIHILILWCVQSHWQSVGHLPKLSPMSAQRPCVWCIYMSKHCGIILTFSTFDLPCQWSSLLNTNQYWIFSLIQLLVCLQGYSNLSLPRFPQTMTLSSGGEKRPLLTLTSCFVVPQMEARALCKLRRCSAPEQLLSALPSLHNPIPLSLTEEDRKFFSSLSITFESICQNV